MCAAVQETPNTLLEKHQESMRGDHAKRKRQRKEAKKESESVVAESEAKHPDWARNNAWRPFDREKDLHIRGRGVRSSGPGPRTDQSLASRFHPASS